MVLFKVKKMTLTVIVCAHFYNNSGTCSFIFWKYNYYKNWDKLNFLFKIIIAKLNVNKSVYNSLQTCNVIYVI